MDWVDKVIPISHVLTVFNSSVNFYVYLLKHFLLKNTNLKMRRMINQDIPLRTELTALSEPDADLKYELLVIKNLQ